MSVSFNILLLLSLTIVGLAAVEFEPKYVSGSESLPQDPAFAWKTLDNGLVLVARQNNEPEDKLSIRLYVHAGSVHEEEHEQGLAHFLEHMAFNGSEAFAPGEMIPHLQSKGIAFGSHSNAHTSFDETVYKLDLPSATDEIMQLGLLIMRETADRLTILPEEVESERGVILAEMRDRDSASMRIWQEQFKTLFKGHRLAERFPIGLKETVAAMSAEDLRNYYKRWYRPERMLLAVVGNRDPGELLAAAEKEFADMEKTKPEEKQEALFGELEIADKMIYQVTPEADDNETSIGLSVVHHEVLAEDSITRRRRSLVHNLAQQCFAQRMKTLLENNPDAPILSAAFYVYRLQNLVMLQCGVSVKDARIQEALMLIERERLQFLKYGPTQAELEIAKQKNLTQLQRTVDQAVNRTNAQYADMAYRSFARGLVMLTPKDELAKYQTILGEISIDEIIKELAVLDAGSRRVLSVTGKGIDNAENLEKDLPQWYVRALTQDLVAPEEKELSQWGYANDYAVGKVTSTSELDHGIKRVVFENNIQASILPRDAEPQRVSLEWRFEISDRNFPAVYAQYAAAMMNGGLGKHDVLALGEILASHQIQVQGPALRDGALVLRAQIPPQELGFTCAYVRAWIQDAAWRKEPFDRLRIQWVEQLRAVERQVKGKSEQAIAEVLAGSVSYFKPVLAPDVESVDHEAVQKWVQGIFSSAPLHCTVVGDIDEATAQNALAKHFASLPQRNAVVAKPEPVFQSPEARSQKIRIESGDTRSIIDFAYAAPDALDVKRARRLQIAGSMVRDVFRELVREELGAAYSPVAYYQGATDYTNRGFFRVQVSVENAQEARLLELIPETLKKLQQEGLTEELFQRIVGPTRGSLEEYRDKNDYWVNSVVARSPWQPQRLNWANSMMEDYQNMRLEEVQALFQALSFEQPILEQVVSNQYE